MTKDRSYPVPISDAGLVLLSPFLPHLFELTGVLAENRTGFDNPATALAQLEYLVDGKTGSSGDPALRLALCGLTQAIEPSPLSVKDQLECDHLLQALLANWPAMSGTSTEGLRSTFLQRPARLDLEDEFGFELIVERKTLDVLVGQIPWSFAVITHPWMVRPIRVNW